ncbi:hypothetical protein MTYP_02556 [Methylophilaceae bacterium]|nr:hypothetical protein MTYP_02556 [Methylophilaceae bacterium]
MSVEQPNVIDLITSDKENGHITLIISDGLEWGENDHLLKLQEKLNNYLAFIKSGDLLSKYPAAQGKHIRLDLVCRFQPDDTGKQFLQLCAEAIMDAGYQFRYRIYEAGLS